MTSDVLVAGLLLFVIIAGLAPLLVLLLYVRRQTGQRDVIQNMILEKHADEFQHGMWFRVRYSTETRFKRIWKIFPWEATGILFVGDQGAIFYGEAAPGREYKKVFQPTDTGLNWLGRQTWPNGGLSWLVLSKGEERHYFTSETGAVILNSQTSTRDIYDRLSRGSAAIPLDMEAEKPFAGDRFAIEKHPHALTAVIVFFVSLLYGLADLLINMESYADGPFFMLYIGVGLLAAATTVAWLYRTKVPAAESAVIGVLLGVGLGLSLYPGLLRANQFTDSQGLRTYSYALEDDLSLVAMQEGLPGLRFGNNKEYWSQFDPGSVHEFSLRRGGLGFYQIDMAPVYEKMGDYYSSRCTSGGRQ